MMSLNKLSYEKVSEEELHPYSEAKGIYANVFDITDKKALDALEREMSSVRQAELITDIPTIVDSSIPDYLYSFKTYALIHERLFSDVYPWAGKLRGFDMMYDGHTFTNANELIFHGEKVFKDFRNKVDKGFSDREEFVKESARFLNLINVLHPFPDGNGRSQRNIISLHFNYHGFEFDWSKIHSWEVYETLKQSFEGEYDSLERMLDKHLIEVDLDIDSWICITSAIYR